MALENLLSCTVGTTGFRLIDYVFKKEAIVAPAIGRTGYDCSYECQAEVVVDDPADLPAAMASVETAMTASGSDFQILVGGKQMHKLLAGDCYQGGPYYTGIELGSSSMVSRKIKFRVTGKTYLVDDSKIEKLFNTHDQGIEGRPDNLRRITWTGVVSGASAADNFQAAVLAPFQKQYPAGQWVVTYRFKADTGGVNGSYTITAEEVLNPLPVGGSKSPAVDGEGRYRRDRDEQYRLTETWEFDLLLGGTDAQGMVDSLRVMVIATAKKNGGSGSILRESVSQTLYRELRVQASYTLLRAADGDRLLDFGQKLELLHDAETYNMKVYPGTNPILVQNATVLRIVTQSGYMVGDGYYPSAPDPLYIDRLIEPPVISWEMVDTVQMKTSWSYKMALPPSGAEEFDFLPADMNQRPDSIDFDGPQPPGGT